MRDREEKQDDERTEGGIGGQDVGSEGALEVYLGV